MRPRRAPELSPAKTLSLEAKKVKGHPFRILRVSEDATTADLLAMYLKLTASRPSVEYDMPVWIPDSVAKAAPRNDPEIPSDEPNGAETSISFVDELCNKKLEYALLQPHIAERWEGLSLKSRLFVKSTYRDRQRQAMLNG